MSVWYEMPSCLAATVLFLCVYVLYSKKLNRKVTEVTGQKFLNHHRRDLIADIVNDRGTARVVELSKQFGVSPMTIRRDIDALAQSLRLERVHGGATRIERASRRVDEPGFATKLALQQAEKSAIAKAAATRIAPGSAIGITAGTTTYQLVDHLLDIENLTVVTNSVPVATALASHLRTGLQVVITGGTPTPSSAIVGPLADRALATLHLDQLFMGVHGMGELTGFTTPNLAEAQTNQAFIRSSNQVIVLADSTKWDLTGLGTIAPLTDAQVLVTDARLADGPRSILERDVGLVDVID